MKQNSLLFQWVKLKIDLHVKFVFKLINYEWLKIYLKIKFNIV